MAIGIGTAMLGSSLIGGLLSSQGSRQGSTSTTQTTVPWAEAQPYLLDVLSRAKGMAGSDPYLSQGVQSPLTDAARNQFMSTLRGDYMGIDNNPVIQNAIEAAKRGTSQQFSGDNYGSSANREWLGRNIATSVAPVLENERGRQFAAAGAAPGFEQSQRAAPWDALQRYQQTVTGASGGYGTTTGQQPYFTNPLAGALGGAMAGAGLYNQFGGGGAGMPSWGQGMSGSWGGFPW